MRARHRKRTILLAITSTHHGFYHGAARYAAEHDWHIAADMIYDATIPFGWKGDGILSFVGHWEELAKWVVSARIPVVEISSVRKDLGLPCVMEDNAGIGRLGAEHLLERNLKNFVWAPFWDDAVNEERFEGFASTIRAAGFNCVRLLPVNTRKTLQLNWSVRRKSILKTIRALGYPLGVFCYNDCVAADIVDACTENEILIPDQVAVLGVDNDPVICDCVQVPLSSVRHDLEGMAYEAAALLDHLIDGRSPPDVPKRIKPKGVVTRKSTDIVAVENPAVADALRFIQNNFCKGNLSVDDVVANGRVPRRSLERAFRSEFRRTILHEILRVRVTHAQKLLETTSQSISDIATRSGFASVHHFYRVFRNRTGQTPRAFRSSRRQPGDLQIAKQNKASRDYMNLGGTPTRRHAPIGRGYSSPL
jgi:LacI family transcriptional regulator